MDLTFIQNEINLLLRNNLWFLAILLIWELVWKGIALWKAAKEGSQYWFIALLLLNTAGILPIVYLLMHNRKNRQPASYLHY